MKLLVPKSISTKKILSLTKNGPLEITHLECEWLKDLLLELSETSPLPDTEIIEKSHLNISIEPLEISTSSVNEGLVLNFSVSAVYQTTSVETMENIEKTMSQSFSACYLEHSIKKDEAYQDQTEIFSQGEMRELYYLDETGSIPLFDTIHEQVYLNFDFYPK